MNTGNRPEEPIEVETKEEVLRLIHTVASQEGKRLPPGASEAEIEALGNRLNIPIPPELVEWLRMCNGPNIGKGGVFGIVPKQKALDIEAHYVYSPVWKERGWIPIAGDGCGDFYVLDTSTKLGSTHPIYFLDQQNFDQPDYIVASGIWQFLCFLLTDPDNDYWPFDKTKVLRQDPLLQNCTTAPLPWAE